MLATLFYLFQNSALGVHSHLTCAQNVNTFFHEVVASHYVVNLGRIV